MSNKYSNRSPSYNTAIGSNSTLIENQRALIGTGQTVLGQAEIARYDPRFKLKEFVTRDIHRSIERFKEGDTEVKEEIDEFFRFLDDRGTIEEMKKEWVKTCLGQM